MLSIIIPVLNEASIIKNLLEHLNKDAISDNVSEIIVVDGGSDDGTPQIVNEYTENQQKIPVFLHSSTKGRARQMNAGAAIAKCEVLYFLHADSLPPKGFDCMILSAVNTNNPAGCFRMKFDDNYFILKLTQWFTRFNVKACRGGDQSLFVSKEIFETLNGFNEDYKVYEDCEFIGRLYDNYSFTVLNDYVITSSRRYSKNGTMRLQYHFAIIHLKKWTGASASELSRYYTKYIIS